MWCMSLVVYVTRHHACDSRCGAGVYVVYRLAQVNIRGASVKLLSSPDPKNDSEYFDLQVCDAVLLYEGQGDVLLEFEEASMHQVRVAPHVCPS